MVRFAAQGRFLFAQGQRSLKDLDDSHLVLEPVPGAKTAGWLVGHLAVTGDFARRLCGRTPTCAREWRALFNPGSHPSSDASGYPPMAVLCDAFLGVYDDLLATAPLVSTDLLDAPNPFTPTADVFPTAGEFAAYLMTGHLAHHLGQMVIWRALAGLGRRPAIGSPPG